MKKFWLVLLSLGLIMAFSVSAFAVDIKVGAEYYVGGLYLNKVRIDQHDDDELISTAFFYQRLRVGTDFIVSPCLKLVTRFDAMERIWGGARSNVWQTNQSGYYPMSAGTQAENENIAFDVAYIDYTSPIGSFQVGYMPDSTWGTVFGNDSTGPTGGLIKWAAPVGPVVLVANYSKAKDNSSSAVSMNSWYGKNRLNATRTDRDTDSYRVGFVYPFKSDKANGQAGALLVYSRDASNRGVASGPYLTRSYKIMPYFKANIGPVALQGEVVYQFGDGRNYEYNGPTIKIDSLSAFLDANAKFGMVTVGGTFAYLQGDDNPYDEVKHDANTGGIDWNPCLIMFNYDTINYWVGGVQGHTSTTVGGPMSNAWFFQGRVGVTPTPQWDVNLSLSHVQADKKPPGFANATYGFEIDLTGTYKITNNLSYMLGVGYLFAGNYYQGRSNDEVLDDYMLINKLTLSF
jgi:hypothetical protein